MKKCEKYEDVRTRIYSHARPMMLWKRVFIYVLLTALISLLAYGHVFWVLGRIGVPYPQLYLLPLLSGLYLSWLIMFHRG